MQDQWDVLTLVLTPSHIQKSYTIDIVTNECAESIIDNRLACYVQWK